MDPDLIDSKNEPAAPVAVEGTGARRGEINPLVGTSSPAPETTGSKPFAFPRLSSLSPVELRMLTERHEEFLRSLSARLSVHFRKEVTLKISTLDAMPFEKFTRQFSNPTHLALAKLEPLKGTCLLEVPPQLALSLVNCELGGAGVCSEKDRPLTEIEARILVRFVEINFSEWCNSWSDLQTLRPALTGHQSDTAFIQPDALKANTLVLGVEMQMGDLTAQMHFGFPYTMLEPLLKTLQAQEETSKKQDAISTPAPAKWNSALNDVRIRVSAELPSLQISAREVAGLKVGDVISLESEVLQNLRISLAKKTKFAAIAGKSGSRWAARITKVV